jgi:hypothetical protein
MEWTRSIKAQPAGNVTSLPAPRYVLVNDVNCHLVLCHLVLFLWTELENLGVLLKNGHVSRFEVIDVSGFQHKLATCGLDAHSASQYMTPMERLAHVVR